jgi:hypothetical protein
MNERTIGTSLNSSTIHLAAGYAIREACPELPLLFEGPFGPRR